MRAAEEEVEDQRTPLITYISDQNAPSDSFHFAYVVYFVLGIGALLPWNSFITAVDYFTYLYPAALINRVFAVAYLASFLFLLTLVVGFGAHKTRAALRINAGLGLFVASLLVVPIVDAVYVKGRSGIYGGYNVTVAAVMVGGMADALMRGGIVGSAGDLPRRYMQAFVAGTAASGVLVTSLRLITKAVYPRDAHGLRKSAIIYFAVGIIIMAVCIFCYNVASKLPVIHHYKELRLQHQEELETNEKSSSSPSSWMSTLRSTVGMLRIFCFSMFITYVVTMSIYPGFITEDVEYSERFKDWYPIMLIAAYNLFDLIGKILPAMYLLQNANVIVSAGLLRLLFYPLFLGCLRGPEYLRRETPVIGLTCLLGLTNGYLTSVLMILAPRAVPAQYAELAGILIVYFFIAGSVAGSVVSWVI